MTEEKRDEPYASFLSTPSSRQWKEIGLKKRSGVATPLFSLYSQKSIGIGEFPDLKLLAAWCKATGLSIIQLLPMNDVGFNFRPYDAQSTFALEPMYLSLEELAEVDTASFRAEIEDVRRRFPPSRERVNYAVKSAKLELLWKMFAGRNWKKSAGLTKFRRKNAYWLNDYALFKVLKERNEERGWESWDEPLRNKKRETVRNFEKENAQSVLFQKWLQWQSFEQLMSAKETAAREGVLLFGDLPFLVSRDSADVWAHQRYFKLNLSAGAPPDSYFANGQNWGMPPYHWGNIESDGFKYLIERLKTAESFYDLFRIDHAVGMFRIWTISKNEPPETAGLNGKYDPADPKLWSGHGRKLLTVMLENTKMLPCAEDLGTIPQCCPDLLKECAIPGMEIQRWVKDWKIGEYKPLETYRKNAIALVATHDITSLRAWWEFEAGTVDEILFKRMCATRGRDFEAVKRSLFDPEKSRHGRLRWKKDISDLHKLLWFVGLRYEDAYEFLELWRGTHDEKERFWKFLGLPGEPSEKPSHAFVEKTLEKCSESAPIFSIQLLQDWLSLDLAELKDVWNYRINFPGTMNDDNWTLVVPHSLEELLRSPLNARIRGINEKTHRL